MPIRPLLVAILLALGGAAALSPRPALAQSRVGSVNTNFRWVGPDDKIVVERYDDPRVANVSCYMSRASTGGLKGWVGLAEDPSRFSVACRAMGKVTIPPDLPRKETVAFSSASLFFKSFRIVRMVDRAKNALIYLVVSTRLIHGSPFNAISVVPVNPGG